MTSVVVDGRGVNDSDIVIVQVSHLSTRKTSRRAGKQPGLLDGFCEAIN